MPRRPVRPTPEELRTAQVRHRITLGFVGVDLVTLLALGLFDADLAVWDPLALVGVGDVLGLVASGFLYLTLLISPLAQAFPRLPGRTTWFLARRGLGLSSLIFALPHALVSFVGPLGGWSGLPFLDPYTGWGLVVGLVALVVLVALGATAWDGAVRRLGWARWKALHRLVYGAGVLVVAHLLLVGTHYANAQSPWTFWTLVAVGVLVVLQALRFDRWWTQRHPHEVRLGPAMVFAAVLLTAAWFWTFDGGVGAGGGGSRWSGHRGLEHGPGTPP